MKKEFHCWVGRKKWPYIVCLKDVDMLLGCMQDVIVIHWSRRWRRLKEADAIEKRISELVEFRDWHEWRDVLE